MTEAVLSTTLAVDDASVTVTLDRDEHGLRAVLSSGDCDLEGEAPGLYYLVQRGASA